MKHKTFISLIALLLLASISFIGCNEDGGGGSSQALTENDLADDPSLRAVPDNQIIVDFLESPGSDTPQYDTGPVGMDDIPLTYPQTETDTFCWTDDNTADMDYMVLLDSQGEEVLRVDVNGDCVTDTVEPGDYVMEFHHDGSMDPHTIFMGPQGGPTQQAMKTDGIFNGFKVEVAKILRGIRNTISKNARAQTSTALLVAYVLATNKCISCEIADADFYKADLRNVNLAYSNLAHANLTDANVRRATLYCTYLGGTRLNFTRFDDADLTGAVLPKNVPNLVGACPTFAGAKWCNGRCTCNNQPFRSLCECTGCGSVTNACRSDCSCRTTGKCYTWPPDLPSTSGLRVPSQR